MFYNKLEILYYVKKGGFIIVFIGRCLYFDMICVVFIYDVFLGVCVGVKSGYGIWKMSKVEFYYICIYVLFMIDDVIVIKFVYFFF